MNTTQLAFEDLTPIIGFGPGPATRPITRTLRELQYARVLCSQSSGPALPTGCRWPKDVSRRPNSDELGPAAEVLLRVAVEHGLSDLHVGDEPSEHVVTVEPSRSYFDVVAVGASLWVSVGAE